MTPPAGARAPRVRWRAWAEPERAFLALAAAFGVAIGALLPPAAAPDETPHLARVWALSEGHVRPPSPPARPATVPRSLPLLHEAMGGEGFPPRVRRRTPAEMRALLAQPLAPERRTGLAHGGAYPPVVYLPSLLGVALGRAFEWSPGWMIYAARAANLAVWIALGWFAVRLCPLRRWTLVALATTPTALGVAASVSADAVTNAAALLFVAVAMRCACGSGRLGRREIAGLLAAALFLGVVKAGYWALAALALAIPAARCASRARWLALVAGVALAVAVPSALWLAAVQAGDPPPASPGADPAAQLRHVLADPLGFARVLASSTAIEAGLWARSFVAVLGLFTVLLPEPLYWAWAGAFVLLAAADGPQPAALTAPRRALLLATFAACFVATLALAYVGWNRVGATHILGVQGRYFIPAAPLLLLALPSRDRALPLAGRAAVVAVIAASGVAAVAGVLGRYWAL